MISSIFSKKVDSVNVLIAADSNVFIGLAVTCYTAALHTAGDTEVNFKILHHGLKNHDWQRLVERIQGAFPNTTFEKRSIPEVIYERCRMNMSYARLFFAEVYPDLERVVYLDTDLMVEMDLTEFYKFSHEDNPVFAVQDLSFPRLETTVLQQHLKDFGYTGDEPYFNGGVLFIDVPRWQEHRIAERTMRIADARPDLNRFWEQTSLNLAMIRPIQLMPMRFNQQMHLAPHRCVHAPLSGASGRVIHMPGLHKPWHFDPLCFNHGIVNQFYKYWNDLEFTDQLPIQHSAGYPKFEPTKSFLRAKCPLLPRIKRTCLRIAGAS